MPTKDLKSLATEPHEYKPHTVVEVCQDSRSVVLVIDAGCDYYAEHIPGEGADIFLLRCRITDKVFGIRLPLKHDTIHVFSKGTIRVNP